MHDIPYERSLDAASALGRIQDDIAALGLGWRIHLLGSPWPVVMAELTDETGAAVTQGVGKGRTELALVGALFEALEHWITDRPTLPSGPDEGGSEDVVFDSSHRFTGIELCRGERVIELLAEAPEAPLPCRRYTALTGAGTLHYPLFLTKPGYWRDARLPGDDFPYASLVRYATNSGTAIGATFEEACIHALGEAVERDALSAFLARRLYAPANDGPLRLVDPDSLTPTLRDLLALAEREAGDRVRLIDIDRGFGIPAFLAVIRAPDGGSPPFGAGASLDAGHAAMRALSELLQVVRVDAYLPDAAAGRATAHARLSPYPRLLRCAAFDPEALIERDGVAHVDLGALPRRPAGGDLADWLADMTGLLERAGHRAFAARLHATPAGTHAVNVVVPGFDRFFNVVLGSPVLPSRTLLDGSGTPPARMPAAAIRPETRIPGRTAAEIRTREAFERRFASDGPGRSPAVERLAEPDREARHLMFHLHVGGSAGRSADGPAGGDIWLGRRLLQPCGDALLMTSRITPEMLLGRWIDTRETEDGLLFHFAPADAGAKRAAIAAARLHGGAGARIVFPHALIGRDGRELLCPDGYWSAGPRLAGLLDEGEAHLRAFTATVVRGLDLPAGAVAFDPACSTGAFLAAVKAAAPQVRTVGADLSPAMVERAALRLDRAFVADAAAVRLPDPCDLLVLRFLNAEVMTAAAAESAFAHLCGQLRAGAHAILVGHTPILVAVEHLAARLGLEILRAVGGRPPDEAGGEEIFQYYLLRRPAA